MQHVREGGVQSFERLLAGLPVDDDVHPHFARVDQIDVDAGLRRTRNMRIATPV